MTTNHNQWPAFVIPCPDELLSSWLLRTAHAHVTKAHTFCKIVWPKLSFWNRDIDRMAIPVVWQTMARQSGISEKKAYDTTLAAYEGILFESHQYQGHNRWLLPLGIYHRERTLYGTQYCPSCLRNDGSRPYYRRWWRLALAVSCPQCNSALLDACPKCQRPIVFHRSEIGRKNELPTYPISCCGYCLTNLADYDSPEIPETLSAYQSRWYTHINHPVEIVDHTYFDALRHLIMMLTSNRPRLIKFQQAVCSEIGIPIWSCYI